MWTTSFVLHIPRLRLYDNAPPMVQYNGKMAYDFDADDGFVTHYRDCNWEGKQRKSVNRYSSYVSWSFGWTAVTEYPSSLPSGRNIDGHVA